MSSTALPGCDPIATSGTPDLRDHGRQHRDPGRDRHMRVRDYSLPARTIFLSVSADNDFTCTHDGALHRWRRRVHRTATSTAPTGSRTTRMGRPAPTADSATIIIKVFARPTVGTMTGRGAGRPTRNEIAEANETATTSTPSRRPSSNETGTISAFNELSITKADTPDPVSTSGVVTCTIVATNNGTRPGGQVVVRDFLPAGFTYIEAADTSLLGDAFFCSFSAGNTVGARGRPCLAVAAARTIGSGRVCLVDAWAIHQPGPNRSGPLIPEGNEANNQASAPDDRRVTPRRRTSTCGSPRRTRPTRSPRAAPSRTVTVENVRTNPAFGVVVRDQLPAGYDVHLGHGRRPSPGDFICSGRVASSPAPAPRSTGCRA